MTEMDIPLMIADEGKKLRNKLIGEIADRFAVFPELNEDDFEEIDDGIPEDLPEETK